MRESDYAARYLDGGEETPVVADVEDPRKLNGVMTTGAGSRMLCAACRKNRGANLCHPCNNRHVLGEHLWYVPPQSAGFRLATDAPEPINQLALDKPGRDAYWHLKFSTLADARAAEQLIVNSQGLGEEELVRRLYLYCIRLYAPDTGVFTESVWHRLICDIMCLKTKKLQLSIDDRGSTCKYLARNNCSESSLYGTTRSKDNIPTTSLRKRVSPD